MTAPGASGDSRDFVCNPRLPRFLSHTHKTGICIFIPLWPLSEICDPAFASLIPGYCLEKKSHQISPSRHQLAAHIPRRNLALFFFFSSPFHSRFRLREVRVNIVILPNSGCVCVPVCVHACVCREGERGTTQAF